MLDVIQGLWEAVILGALPIGAILFTIWSFKDDDRTRFYDMGTRYLCNRD